MHNAYFTEAMLGVLLAPERWALVSSWYPPELPAVTQARHAAWAAAHEDRHAHREVLVTLTGGGWQGYNGAVYRRRPGAIFFFEAFEAHDFFMPASSPGEDQLWITLLGEHVVFRLIAKRAGQRPPAAAWQRVLSRAEVGVPAWMPACAALCHPEVARLQLRSCIGLLLGAITAAGYAEAPAEESGHARLIHAVQQHIRDTAGNGMTLEHLAQLAGYSKYHFLRLFTRHTGQTVHAYIDTCRLQRMQEMRAAGHAQKEIAAALGFSCPSSYAHWVQRKCRGTRQA